MSVLTDRDRYALAWVGYRHRQTESRAAAADWVREYCVKKARANHDVSLEFNKNCQVSEAEEKLILGASPWTESVFYKEGKNGALVADHDKLLSHFKKEHAYKTIADMKAVYVFNGTHYTDMTPIEIKGYAERMFDPRPNEKTRNEFVAKAFANEITRRSFFTETTEGKINFKNGVLDLKRDELGGIHPITVFGGFYPMNTMNLLFAHFLKIG